MQSLCSSMARKRDFNCKSSVCSLHKALEGCFLLVFYPGVEILLYGLEKDVSTLLEPCLKEIGKKFDLFDEEDVIREVFKYSPKNHDPITAYKMNNAVATTIKGIKNVPVRFKME